MILYLRRIFPPKYISLAQFANHISNQVITQIPSEVEVVEVDEKLKRNTAWTLVVATYTR